MGDRVRPEAMLIPDPFCEVGHRRLDQKVVDARWRAGAGACPYEGNVNLWAFANTALRESARDSSTRPGSKALRGREYTFRAAKMARNRSIVRRIN
jgi:hypothetical protein